MDMHTYRVTPKAPLVFRSGKPFLAGTRDKANYPWPSAWAGLLRSRYMEQHGIASADATRLLQQPAHGALLARHKPDEPLRLHLPRPADALALASVKDGASGAPTFRRLVPCPIPAGTGSDLPAGMLPVGLTGNEKGKPQPSAAFWAMEDYQRWASGEPVSVTSSDGLELPKEETRTHVAIDRGRQAASDGQLFQTTALDFSCREGGWVFVGRGPAGLSEGLVTFGGERRLSMLEREKDAVLRLPKAISGLFSVAQGFAATLATPALFGKGWRPGWLGEDGRGLWPNSTLRVRLRAAVVERWQPVSGWDLRRHQPKPMRRAVAAGATYWFEIIEGDLDPAALWLLPISDDEQDRRDGFGLVVLRPWKPFA